jgi:hypothetical protein
MEDTIMTFILSFRIAGISRRLCIISLLTIIAVMTFFTNTSGADINEIIKLIPEGGSYADYFGSSVAISGDYAIVGAPNDDEGVILNSGCAYIFERGTKGIWSQKAKLLAPDRAHNDTFGASVSISGNYAIVGKPFDDHTGNNYGSAYIFRRTEPIPGNIIWSQVAKLVAITEEGTSDGGPNDYFGTSVAINGDYAIVGAPYDDDNGIDSGSAYIFHRVENTWSRLAKLVAPDPAAGDLFGYSVAISGDDAAVGAPRRDNDSGDDIGSIYFFKRSEDTWSTWGEQYAIDSGAGDELGWSVAIDDHFAIAGAPFYDGGEGLDNSGSALVFEELDDTGIWSIAPDWLKPSDAAASDEFGFAVSISGDYAVVGSLKYLHGTGTAYVFKKASGDDAWSQFLKLVATDAPWGFGSAVSINGRYAIVGARHAESAYIFDIFANSGPPLEPSFSGVMPGILLLLLD